MNSALLLSASGLSASNRDSAETSWFLAKMEAKARSELSRSARPASFTAFAMWAQPPGTKVSSRNQFSLGIQSWLVKSW